VHVQLPFLFRRRLTLATAAVVLAVIASACSGGARPTLTGDRLVETPESAESPPDTVAAHTVAAPTVAAPTVAADPAASAGPESDPATGDDNTSTSRTVTNGVEQMVVEVLETFPHDATGFTQGLELFDGVLLESTGLYGESEVRRVDPGTGEVLQRVGIDPEFFAEGLTRVGDQIIQLTWRENTALYWDATTLEPTNRASYEGEGWGLCYDGFQLVMSDGTPTLIFRDPTSFTETSRVPVTLNGQDVFNLNELECVDGVVWANIWQTDLIVRIDPATGVVTGVVDAFALDGPAEPQGAVLNGIAWDATTQSFYVTGKLWPTMYRVNFVPAPSS